MSNNSSKKDWPARTFRIPPELLDRLDTYGKQTGISKTFIVRKSLEQYLDKNEGKKRIEMSDPKLISLLRETLSAVKSVSNGIPGWQAIISLYENAIEKAGRGEPFSVQDAPRIYLEFSSDYTSDIFKLLEKTALKTQHLSS